ncbi:MAG: prepilin-type N-terminal cleavage/methylation domain-containing protein [Desulfobulbus sp.]|nr:prepilin-type N-terminal cleavage/methylation domain-containing protein [Desulfobulbus sp.]
MIATDKGFTLLEVLLAVTVLGVVAAMLSLSLGGTLRVVAATEQQEAAHHQAHTALRRLTADLASAVQAGEIAFTGQAGVDGAEGDAEAGELLRFVSLAHLVFNPAPQRSNEAMIAYRVVPDADDRHRLKLLRADTVVLPGIDPEAAQDDEIPFLLADNLRAVRLAYLDREGREYDGWGSEQEAADQAEPRPLPAAVRCTLEFWLDADSETFQAFTTAVLVPAGLIGAEAADAD